jgi:anaerobic selenocysteine-containing dehydrogenase
VTFTKPAAGSPNTQGSPVVGRGTRIPGSKRTRERELPSALGEMPTATMAEEIDTPSEDGTRIRALVTVAGNPTLSSPNATRLEKALESLDFMVSIDIYLNETTRKPMSSYPLPRH